jgi:predicted transcriptional regulator of viral defense system
VRATEAFVALRALGRPVITTSEAGLALKAEISSAAHTLSRLEDAGLIRRIRNGLWSIDAASADERSILCALTRPFPSYVSSYSALFKHGMIDQVPRATYAISLGRSSRVSSTRGAFVIRHIRGELFGGFEGATSSRSGLATPEKALFDTVYHLTASGGAASLPELEIPEGFDSDLLWGWVERVASRRLQTLVSRRLDALVAAATSAP